jgi:hypothetical protein
MFNTITMTTTLEFICRFLKLKGGKDPLLLAMVVNLVLFKVNLRGSTNFELCLGAHFYGMVA